MKLMRPATQFFGCWCVLGSVAYSQTIDLASAGGRWLVDGAAPGARTGAWLAAGDLTGDFWTRELIVGAPDEAGARGAVRLFLRRPQSPNSTTATADVVLTGAAAGDKFGAAADPGFVMQQEVQVINGNPVGATPPRDLVVGAPGANGGRGVVYVFPAPFARGETRTPSNAAFTILGAVPGDSLGNIIETADLNGDRYREIILAVPSRGIVYAIDTRASATTTIDLASHVPGTIFSGLGSEIAIAVGDMTGEGGLDLAIGDPTAHSARGAVYLIRGRSAALPAALSLATQADAQAVGADVGDRFGAAIWVADIDDDGDYSAELLIGAPGADGAGNSRTDAGEVHVIWGRPDVAAAFRSGLTLYGAAAGHRLGSLVTAGNITRKTPFDIVMLAAGAHGGAGEVFVYYGRHRFEFPSASADLATAAGRRLIADETEGAIVRVRTWEATGEGAEEIVIGVPSATTAAGLQAGRLYVPLSPRLDLSAGSMTMRVPRCAPGVQEVEIRNPSAVPVPWRLFDAPSWIEIQPATGTTALGASATVKLVARTSELTPGTHAHRVWILSNGPHLGHTAPIDIQLTVDPAAPLASNAQVDFGRDGCGDLAVLTPGGVWHVPGESNRQLGVRGDIPVAGDYDGDLRADLAVFRPSTAEWLFEGSTVRHGAPGDLPVPADYDGDGRMDMAVFTPATATWWVRGRTPVQFGQPRDLPIPADYNGDGLAEFAVYRRSSGTWVISGTAPVQWGSGSDVPVPADYDGDGRAEIAVFVRSSATWRIRGGATIQFGSAGDLPAAFDVDRDRRADLVLWRRTTRTWLIQTATQLTMTVPGPADGLPAWTRPYLISGTNVDFTNDGSTDLVWQHADGRIMIWQMNGSTRMATGTFTPERVDAGWQMVGTADFNRDGHPDLLWRHADGRIAVWLMNGSTIVEGRYLTPDRVTDANWRLLANGDMNGDGHVDLLWYHTDGSVAVWLMRETTLIDGSVIARVEDRNWLLVGAGDANSDGQVDLYWSNRATGWLAFWIMDGLRIADGRIIPLRVEDPTWSVAGVTDLNGDGYADLLWQHDVQRYVAAWLLAGDRLLDASMLTPNRMSDTRWRLAGPR